MNNLKQAKDKIVSELEYSECARSFFKQANIDDILTVVSILQTVGIVDSMSLTDYNIIQECLEIVSDNEDF